MLVSYQWLNQYVDLNGVTPEKLAEELTRGGIEVDVIHPLDQGVENVVTGVVKKVEPHPGADRLRVCTVDAGKEEPLNIVCGAPNVAEGQTVAVALPGARLPGGVKIKKTKLRGVPSEGMICSAQELGMPEKLLPKEQQEGILVLPAETGVGEDAKAVLGLEDVVLELDLTPNRSDCLSMWGVAYEVAALLDREVHLPVTEERMPVGKTKPVDVVLDAEEDCPFYATQVVEGIRLGESPRWMQNRLLAAGIRPINNVVDITNYVMLEYGQPLHAFDYDQVEDGEIVVRRGGTGETVTTLDGVTRACDDRTLLITDGTKPIGIAGVMGGENSEVKEGTTTVLIESAYFAPESIRRTARRLGLRSEASTRFEKGVDPERVIPALTRAVELMVQLAGGKVASPVTAERMGEIEDVIVELRHNRLTGVLGVQVEEKAVLDVFRRLRFPTEVNDGVYRVQVPSRRPDISIEVDLIEEVARLYGYDRIPTTLPWGQQSPGALTPEQRLRRVIRHSLRDAGFHEVINYSLTSPDRLRELEPVLYKEARPIRISMPMSDERKVLRTSLVPQLLETAEYNVHRREEGVSVFELARVFVTEEKKLTRQPEERWALAGLVTGATSPHWQKRNGAPDFFTVKGMLEWLFERLGVNGISFEAAQPEGYHPGRTARIKQDGRVIGVLGQVHPKTASAHDLDDTYVFELDLEPVTEAALNRVIRYETLPKHPDTTRDLALVVDEGIPVGELEKTIHSAGGELLQSVSLFDVFTGEQIGEGKKSVAFSLRYQAGDRTLTDEEVAEVHQNVIQRLEEKHGAVLRK
ncbi:phenylalanyl-tRNA synthetase beta subunit [Melghirimyces profundicolus]|uniref:Phenylalanine--tRNA ligase beta subunit n=1 Tax=Melghirimyces profundicolus TaxID=1242148 RepID=A0A2T6BG50_9BACL|nr:phenylalanine--tRNA ligase subunit beta [Melghirimyces profundicolus]PTX55030.1 phenylalanyl-tRNA synthetase beta subunit [Melghirimyces profundicolus]